MTAVILSLAAHIIVLALAGFLGDSGGTDRGDDLLTVTLEKHPGGTVKKPGGPYEDEAGPPKDTPKHTEGALADTVNLDRMDTKYYPYLLQVKERIDRQWSYPPDAVSRGETGITVVEFSIARGGVLIDCHAVVSSGFEALDSESLRAVQSAAPFAPLSERFGLARLNIVAKFRYSLAE